MSEPGTLRPNILIVTEATLGMGHTRAAEALRDAFLTEAPDAVVRVTTALVPQAEALFNRLYGQTLARMPHLWGAAYASERWTSILAKRAFGVSGLSRAKELFDAFRPDVVVSTHALSVPPFARLKRRRPFTLAVAITDFDANGFWINRRVDHYFVAHPDVARTLAARYRLDVGRFQATGIPIDPRFADPTLPERARALRAALGLGPAEPLVLLMGGGEGLLDMPTVLQALDRRPEPFAVAAVAGRNGALRETLENLRSRLSRRLIVAGWITETATWLSAADVVVTKPGGLTLSELFALGKAAVLLQPIPGQETRNVHFVERHGAATVVDDAEEAARTVGALLGDPDRRAALEAAARRLGRPEAARTIARTLLETLANGARTPEAVVR
ncbi:MAG: glycosyltransferase [Hydrogenibacillus schlegelii]|uniref:Glycosyltransferase n=1 Tax=Hydrogenibacillus schlegelii TaxID=1484 RepID=A0A947G9E7_HYDSH|nr:glycosyltransferase [Hydrogenibacillus schlegelii]